MRLENWRHAPLGILGMKLAEEAGEVCKVLTDAWKHRTSPEHATPLTAHSRKKLREEIGHVEAICREITKRLDNGHDFL